MTGGALAMLPADTTEAMVCGQACLSIRIPHALQVHTSPGIWVVELLIVLCL